MNKKTFEVTVDGQVKKLAALRPNYKTKQRATLVYNKAFREAVEAGSIVRQKLDSVLRKQDLWDDDKEAQYKELRARLLENERKLAKGGIKLAEAEKLAKQMVQDRADFRELNRDRNELDQKTAEAHADNAHFNYLVSACTVDAETGKPYFASYEEYEESDDPVAAHAANALGTLLYDLDDDYQKKLPENRFLLKYGFMNDDMRFIRKSDGKLVDIEGRLVNEKGQLVNEEGQLVDTEGNLIDEEGEYIVDFEPFLDDEGNPVEEKAEETPEPQQEKGEEKAEPEAETEVSTPPKPTEPLSAEESAAPQPALAI